MANTQPTTTKVNMAPKLYKVIGDKYVDAGRIGEAGNDFGTHITIHFSNGEYHNYNREYLEEVTQ